MDKGIRLISNERQRQVGLGWTAEHDKHHTPAEWAWLIEQRLQELRTDKTTDPITKHHLFAQVGALAAAAIDAIDA